MRTRSIAALCFAMAALGVLSTATGAVITQKGRVRVQVEGSLSPKKLPRTSEAPVSVSVSGKVSATDEGMPPQLEGLSIQINRHGNLDGTGLPFCKTPDIQPASTARALAACRASLVGTGRFQANVTLSGQAPYPTEGKLLLFNGTRHGKPVLLGQIYAAHPFATSFVIPFEVKRLAHGTFGTELVAALPHALVSWGNLTGIEMNLSRRYTYRGKRRSYVSAGCPAPKGFSKAPFPLVRVSFRFAGGQSLTSTLTRSCGVRG